MSALRAEVVTVNADGDDLTPEQYREIFDDLRTGHSLDSIVSMLDSSYSKAHWSRYERQQVELTRRMQNELRRAVGLPDRVPTVAEATADVDPSAEVVRVSNGTVGPAQRVILVATAQPVTLRCAEAVEVLPGESAPIVGDRTVARVPARTRSTRGFNVPGRVYARLAAVRREMGVSWGELFDRLLDDRERGDEAPK